MLADIRLHVILFTIYPELLIVSVLNSHVIPSDTAFHICITTLVVLQVVYQLYHDPNPDNKDTAQKWLIQVQNSPEAWQLCWLLLQQQQKQEVAFFGATILNYKIVRAWCVCVRARVCVKHLGAFVYGCHHYVQYIYCALQEGITAGTV